MNISNTLWNDTKEAIIAYAKQLKDNQIDWTDSSKKYNETYINKQGQTVPVIDPSFKTEGNKLQDRLNEFFLNHWADFQMFLNDKGVDGVIDTWRDVEEFLEDISDDDATTLMGIINTLQEASGNLNIRMSSTIPGLMEAVTRTEEPVIGKSHIENTGMIKIVYNFN